ncbi:MAG: hypothetical protein AAB890_01080, partial [Patescibacteria group bacterium]
VHGQPRKIDKYTIFPMFHPAAALRATGMMNQFLEDFKKLRDLINLPTDKDKVVELSSEQLNLI